MLDEIKNKIEESLTYYSRNINHFYHLKAYSPILSESIAGYILRKGKRIRPSLFVASYLGFAKKPGKNLYISALSFELLHNFLLIHDDIIDKSDLRRGLPAMHKWLQKYIKDSNHPKFNGSDLAIVAADIIYAMAVDAFMAIKENPENKIRALKKFTESAIATGSGEFVELLYSSKNLAKIQKNDINKIYDLKTSQYTFCSPLAIGAILAGAKEKQVNKLIKYGLYLGRAFQIKDDILDMFGKQNEIGKSPLTDIKESKKTMLIWYAYRNSTMKQRDTIKNIFNKKSPVMSDLLEIRHIVLDCKALDYAKKQIKSFLCRALKTASSLDMKPAYKKILLNYPKEFLKI